MTQMTEHGQVLWITTASSSVIRQVRSVQQVAGTLPRATPATGY